MPYDRAWLREQVREYLHDQVLTDSTVDGFIDIATKRIAQKLRSQENQVTVDWQLNDSASDLPADLIDLKTVRAPVSGGQFALQSIPSHSIDNYNNRTGGQPLYYSKRGDKITVRPFVAGTYELTYWQTVDIGPAETNTNDAVEAFPFLFLNAALEAGQTYKQDEQQRQVMQGLWLGEVNEINKVAARQDSGDAPAMRAF